MLKTDLELENKRKQFGWYGFFIILLAYIFKFLIFYLAEGMYFSYTLSTFADIGIKLTEVISNFLIVLFVVKFIVKAQDLETGIFRKFIVNILIPSCILIFLELFTRGIYSEAMKYEFWNYLFILILAVIEVLKGFIWIAGIFIFISDKDFVLFDFIKEVSKKISMIIAVSLITFLISINLIIFDLKGIRSILFSREVALTEGIIYFAVIVFSIYTILGILLFFTNMLINSSDEIKSSKDKNIIFVVNFIRENMAFFISRIVIPQILLFFVYENITNIVSDTTWGKIFVIVLRIGFFVFGALVEAVILKLIFNALNFPVKQSILKVWLFGIFGLFAGNWFRILFGKGFILFSERGEYILRDFSRVENIQDITIASTYLTLTFIFMIVFTIFSICIGWVTKNQWSLEPSVPFAFIWFINPLKVSIMSFVGFVIFFYYYSVSQNFYFSFGFVSEPFYLLILFSSIVVGSVFLVYLAFKFINIWKKYEKVYEK